MGNPIKEGSLYIKISALLMFLALFLHFISMGAPDWAKADADLTKRKEHIGLWRYCVDTIGGGTECNAFIDIVVGDWIRAAQGFSILALFTMLGAVAILILCVVKGDDDDPRLLMIGITLTGVSALFKLIEVATFACTYQEYFKNKDPGIWGEVGVLAWAFYVALVSLLLNCGTVVTLVLDMAQGSDK